jgi:hypothetical protein
MRLTEPLHASALLIDQHRRFTADSRTACTNEFSDLGRRTDVSLEEDQTPWIGLAKKRAFVGGQVGASQSGNESAYRHRRRLACDYG